MKSFARLIVPLGIAAASAIGCWLSVSDVEIAGEAFWANVKSVSGLAKYPPLREVAFQLPYDQARFWLDELQDLQPENILDSSSAAAVAVLLNAPRGHFITEFPKPSPKTETLRAPGFAAHIEFDFKEFNRAAQKFEDACWQRCLQFANAAAVREPDNPEWWRLYAILQFRMTDGLHLAPRTADWKAQLLVAETHDPDNGLYPLLIAACCWQLSGELEYDRSAGGLIPVINNDDLFDEGWAHFHLALSRRHITAPIDDARMTYEFLVSRGHTRFEAASVASDLTLRSPLLIRHVRAFQWILAAISQSDHDGDYEGAVRMSQDAVELANKILADDAVSDADLSIKLCRSLANYRIAEIAEHHPELVADREHPDLFELLVASTIELEVDKRTDLALSGFFGVTKDSSRVPHSGETAVSLCMAGCMIIMLSGMLAVWGGHIMDWSVIRALSRTARGKTPGILSVVEAAARRLKTPALLTGCGLFSMGCLLFRLSIFECNARYQQQQMYVCDYPEYLALRKLLEQGIRSDSVQMAIIQDKAVILARNNEAARQSNSR